MPVGYLLAVVFVAAGTLLALAPVRRPRPLASLSFRLGVVFNELPVLACYWLLIWTLVALVQGDLGVPGGWAPAALAIATVSGLAVVGWRGLRARPALQDALAAALGASWRAAVTGEPGAAEPGRHPLARVLLRPLHTRRRDVERVADVSYGAAGKSNLLDIYRLRSRPAGAPVLIHLHGGSFRRGRKSSQALPLLYRLASHGWVCISANYRMRPAAGLSDHLIDVKSVIAWVREHGHEYGAGPASLFLAGSSAGGHLAALAALTPGDPAFQPGFEDADTTVTAAICLNGYYGSYFGQGPSSSPLAQVRVDAPPFFIAHGDRDTVVPAASARLFASQLRSAAANPVVYAELPGAQHAFDLFPSLRFEAVVDAIESFAAWVISAREARPAQP